MNLRANVVRKGAFISEKKRVLFFLRWIWFVNR